MNQLLDYLKLDAVNFSMKFIFDFIRNVGLCAIIFAIAKVTWEGAGVNILPKEVNAIFLGIVAISLTLLNIFQFSVVAINHFKGLNKITAYMVTIILTLWVQASMYHLLVIQSKLITGG